MGIFDSYRAIGRINALIKQLEPKLDYISNEIQYPLTANVVRLRAECMAVSVLMDEIFNIIEHSSRSVSLAPYYLHGQKCEIQDVGIYAAILIERAKGFLE